ncbi:MAG: sigma 54-interacting transcriptional regulator, partial [Myxococcota bacterium]
MNLANVLVLLGELAQAQEEAERTARLCVEQGMGQAETMAHLVAAEAAIEGQRFEVARERLAAVESGLERMTDALAAGEAKLLEARLLSREGEHERAAHCLAELRVPSAANLPARRHLEWADAVVGMSSNTARSEVTAEALRMSEGLGDEGRWRALTVHARALEMEGEQDAQQYFDEALRVLERFLASLTERHRGAYLSTSWRRSLREWIRASQLSTSSRRASPKPPTAPVLPPQTDRTYRRLLALNRQLAREADPDVLLERIVDAAIELLGAERGFILLESESGVSVAVARNLDRRSLEGGALRYSRSIANDVFQSGEAVVTSNAQSDSRYADARSVASNQIRSALCVPLRGISRNDDPLIGALYLDHRFQDRAFGDGDVELGASFADQVTIALENARLVARVRAQELSLEERNERLEELNRSLQRDAAESAEAAEAAIRRLREEGPTLGVGRGLEGIVGRSNGLRQALRFVDRFADTDVPVAVVGESGTGKELIARALHERSDRHGSAFVTVNCGAIPETLIESELFGHVKGAFTGAHRDRPGLFSAASGGTLFLDEIAEMPLQMQVKLLRVLQENEFRPVGGVETLRSSARVVAATHRDLQARVREGLFREDLFYRLNVVEIRVPPLRERRDDIPLLVEHFCRGFTECGSEEMFHPDALLRMFAYDWPGNVRELQNEVQRALALSEGRVGVDDLSERLQAVRVSRAQTAATHARGSLKEIMDSFEKEVLLIALERTSWNVRQTAKE